MEPPADQLQDYAEQAVRVHDLDSARRLVAEIYHAGSESRDGLSEQALQSLLQQHADAGLVLAAEDQMARNESQRK
jgi:hypothetical protein